MIEIDRLVYFLLAIVLVTIYSVEMGAGQMHRARTHSAPAFVYEHCTEPKFSKEQSYAGTMDIRPEFSKCDHGDCYSFIFGLPFYEENAQEQSETLKTLANVISFHTANRVSSFLPLKSSFQ